MECRPPKYIPQLHRGWKNRLKNSDLSFPVLHANVIAKDNLTTGDTEQ